MDLSGYDASQYEPNVGGGGSPVPPGDYTVIISATEEKATKSGEGSYLQCDFEIIDGPEKGRKVYARLNLRNNSTVAVEIAQRELSAICHAVGVLRPSSSSDLHNIPLIVTVILEQRNDDPSKQSNKIVGYHTRGGGAAAPQPAPQANFGQPQASSAVGTKPVWQR